MSEKKVQYSALCPICKKMVYFKLSELELENKFYGGLASFSLAVHGTPPHILTVYIDKERKVRGTYSTIVETSTTSPATATLQFNHVVDATSEMTFEEGNFLGIKVLPYEIIIDDKITKTYLIDLAFSDIVNLIIEKHKLGSNPVKVEEFLEVYKSFENDKPVIVTTITSKFSEIYNNAVKAKKMLEKEAPSFASNITVIDSNLVGPLQKMMAKTAVEMDQKGKDMQEIKDRLDLLRTSHRSFVVVDTLEYLRKSNRIGRVAGFFGSLLGIKPVLTANLEGEGNLKGYKSVRTRESGLREIINLVEKHSKGEEIAGVIVHGMCEEDALSFRELLEKELSIDKEDFTIEYIGSGMAIHLGLGCLGVSVYPKT